MFRIALLPVVAGLILLAAGCSPSLSPLYRDYEVEVQETPVETRIIQALEDAGWEIQPTGTSNVVATKERRVNRWGLYDVVVHLEATPVGNDYVRVFFHPYRRYFTGRRSKMAFLNNTLRNALLKNLNEALSEQGLHAVGSAVERDRELTEH